MKRNTGRKMLGILLGLAMVLGLLPGMCLTAYAVDYDIWVGDRKVTSDNASDVFGDETVKYTPASGTTPATLTLKGYNGTKYIQLTNNYYGIYSNNPNNDLKIITSGTNSITAEAAGSDMNFCGIYVEGDLTIGGSGSLSVRGGADSAEDMYATYGIYCGGYLTIESSVKAEAGKASGFDGQSSGVWAKTGITVNGSLTATAGTAKSDSMGIGTGSISSITTAGIIVNNGGILNATSGTVIGDNNNSCGVFVNSGIFIKDGGTFSATGGTATGNESRSHGAYLSSGFLTVKSGGKMNAKGQAASYQSEGIYGDVIVDGTLIASGSNLAINGGVINSITGTGWTNTEGTEGMASIDVSPGWQTLEYKRVQFPEASAASVTTKPEARTLTYSGSAQELVTAGAASGGTMQYALGTDDKTTPTSGWSTTIPTGTDAGTYYVWYKAVGDATHTDSDAACVTVTIAAKPAPTEAPTSVPTATPKPVPKTGDSTNPALWLALILLGLTGAAGTVLVKVRKR